MKSSSHNIKKYVVVGGGTAGWISAAVLSRALAPMGCQIHLVESPNVNKVGVGEATIPSIIDLLEYLKISVQDFISNTNATFKLAIKFNDWKEKGHHYWHPFGYIGSPIDGQAFYHHWLKHHLNDGQFSYTDFSPSTAMAKENKFHISDPQHPTQLSASTYALHFDAELVARYLREYCVGRGVLHKTAHVESAETDSFGNIKHLVFDDGEKLEGDFFIDCSGQKALLIEKTLRVGHDNWQHYLPVDRAVVVQSEKTHPLVPYTESTAHEHGWRWRIPLQNRTGNGYVYCSDYCTDEDARKLLLENISGEILTEPRILKFRTGKRKKMWHRNCLAVGLSSGFLEPLESTSIYLAMKAILNFTQFVPDIFFAQANSNEFNRLMDGEYECIRDFIVLHYCASKRNDSAFWRMWQQLDIPASLQMKLDIFRSYGRLYRNHDDLFSQDSWYAVLEGMGLRPNVYNPLVDASKTELVEQALVNTKTKLDHLISHTLDHDAFIRRYLGHVER